MTIIVSFSEVMKYQTCQRAYYYAHSLKLRPATESAAIQTGINGHKLLQTYFEKRLEGFSHEEALTFVDDEANKLIRKEKVIDMELLKAWTMVKNYLTTHDIVGESVLIENRFLIPATKLVPNYSRDLDIDWAEVQIGFTPDLVKQRNGGFIDIEDAKFIGRKWSYKKLERYPQTKLYHVFLEAIDYNISRTFIRFFNLETYKIYTHSYDPSPKEKEILLRDFMEGVRQVVLFKTSDLKYTQPLAIRTMNYGACQFCSYTVPCDLQAKGKDASGEINSNFIVKEDYDYSR